MIRGPHKASDITLSILAVISLIIVYFASETTRLNQWHRYKLTAANIMQEASAALKSEQESRGIALNAIDDTGATGLIGEKNSPITTDRGFLDMKVMTTNPNLASVVLDMLKEAGLKPNDLVAVGYTGSLPGANIAVLSAIESLGLDAIIISSAGSSNWGANNPDFTWLDMENSLFKKGVFKHRSIASSLGGRQDRGIGMSSEGKELLENAIKRNGLIYINEGNLEANIYKRLALYKEHSQKKCKRIKCYVNVGGGVASVGSQANAQLIPNGLSNNLPVRRLKKIGVMTHMAGDNIPIIHLLKMREIVYKYGLPSIPPSKPAIGEGRVFLEEKLSGSVALLALVVLVAIIFIGLTIDFVLIPKLKAKANE